MEGEHGLAGCPLNSPSLFIPELHILFKQALTFHVIVNSVPPGIFQASCLSNSFNVILISVQFSDSCWWQQEGHPATKTLHGCQQEATSAQKCDGIFLCGLCCVARWRSGRVPCLRSVGRGFKSQPPRCRVQPWASC